MLSDIQITTELFVVMVVVLHALEAPVVAEEVAAESLAILVSAYGKNTGTWTSYPSLKRISISSTPMLPAGHRYVVNVVVMQHRYNVLSAARGSYTIRCGLCKISLISFLLIARGRAVPDGQNNYVQRKRVP